MNRALALAALVALAAGCQATATGTVTPGGASAKPGTTASATPAGASAQPGTASTGPATSSPAPAASASAAPASGTEVASIMLEVDGTAVDVSKTFEYGTTSKAVAWDFNKPERGYTAAGKWWITVGLQGKTTAPNVAPFTAADVQAVSVVFRQGTGATSAEKGYSAGMLEASQYTLADGKLDIDFKGPVELASATGSTDKIEVEFVMKGAPIK